MHDFSKTQKLNWEERNSIKMNADYICKIFKHFNIDESFYNFSHDGFGDYNITISLKNRYLVQIDKENMSYNLLIEARAMNPNKKVKYISKKDKNKNKKAFYGEDIMYDVLKYIIKSENISNKEKE